MRYKLIIFIILLFSITMICYADWKTATSEWVKVGSGATASSSDKIEEGNSKVEVVDAGVGYITSEVDGTEYMRIKPDDIEMYTTFDWDSSANTEVVTWDTVFDIDGSAIDYDMHTFTSAVTDSTAHNLTGYIVSIVRNNTINAGGYDGQGGLEIVMNDGPNININTAGIGNAFWIDDNRTGAEADNPNEASLVIDSEGHYAFSLVDGEGYFADGFISDGAVEFNSDVGFVFEDQTDYLDFYVEMEIDGAAFDLDAFLMTSAITDATAHDLTGAILSIVNDNDLDEGGTDNQLALEIITGAAPTWSYATGGGVGIENNLELYANIYFNDGTYVHIIEHSQAEGLAGSDLRFGLDEANRSIIICDSGDITDDFGLTARGDPSIIFADDGGIRFSSFSQEGNDFYIRALSNFGGLHVWDNGNADRVLNLDIASGDYFTFRTANVNTELDDTDGEQSFVSIQPRLDQSATAGYNALEIYAIEDALGDASATTSGTNNLIIAGTAADPDMFRVTNDGAVHIEDEINFYDSDCTDDDINAKIYVDATDTGSGTEDVNMYFQAQLNGTLNTFMTWDIDSSLTFKVADQRVMGATTNTVNFGLNNNYASVQINNVASATDPSFVPHSSDEDTGIGWAGLDQLSLVAGSVSMLQLIEGDADYVETKVGTVYTPSSDQARADDSTITIDTTIIRVVGDGAAVVLDTDPAIEDGVTDGQIIFVQGTSDANTVQIADAVNTQLEGGVAFTLGQGDMLQLTWDSGDSTWYEISRSDN